MGYGRHPLLLLLYLPFLRYSILTVGNSNATAAPSDTAEDPALGPGWLQINTVEPTRENKSTARDTWSRTRNGRRMITRAVSSSARTLGRGRSGGAKGSPCSSSSSSSINNSSSSGSTSRGSRALAFLAPSLQQQSWPNETLVALCTEEPVPFSASLAGRERCR